MTEIKNLQFQPLTFHLANGRGLHLGPRERRELAESDISPEIALAARRGLVQLVPLPEPLAIDRSTSCADSTTTGPAEVAGAIEGPPSPATDDGPAGTGRRKRK